MTCPHCNGIGEIGYEANDMDSGPGMTVDVVENCERCKGGELTCTTCDQPAAGVSTTSRKALCVTCLAIELIAADVRWLWEAHGVVARAAGMARA